MIGVYATLKDISLTPLAHSSFPAEYNPTSAYMYKTERKDILYLNTSFKEKNKKNFSKLGKLGSSIMFKISLNHAQVW